MATHTKPTKDILRPLKIGRGREVSLFGDIMRQALSPVKLKDSPIDRKGIVVKNNNGEHLVLEQIIVEKVPGKSNTIRVILVGPDPEKYDFILNKKEEIKKAERT